MAKKEVETKETKDTKKVAAKATAKTAAKATAKVSAKAKKEDTAEEKKTAKAAKAEKDTEEKKTVKKAEEKAPKAAKEPKAKKAAKSAKAEAESTSNDGEAHEFDEATKELFTQKIKDILALAKKKKNVLEYSEISDFFTDLNLNEEQLDNVLEVLESSGIYVLRVSEVDDDLPDEDDMMLSDEDEVDMENIDLSVPDGISIEDPVRMYLKEIGKVPLLNADQEIELARAMEAGADAQKQLDDDKDKNELSEAEKKELNQAIYEGEEAKKRLAEANLRLVVSIAKRYVGR